MSNLVKVGMADLNVVTCPDGLTTLGLGSCVGIILYDPIIKVAGLAHVMLPYSHEIRDNSNIAKFADTGIVKMLEDLKKLGALQSRLIAKIAGGAQMFAFKQSCDDIMKVGYRNVISTKETLAKLGIPIVAEDTGGNFGRTIEFYTETGVLLIKTIGLGVKEI